RDRTLESKNIAPMSRPPPRPSPEAGRRLRPRQEKYRGDVETPSPTLPARGREIRGWKGSWGRQAQTGNTPCLRLTRGRVFVAYKANRAASSLRRSDGATTASMIRSDARR